MNYDTFLYDGVTVLKFLRINADDRIINFIEKNKDKLFDGDNVQKENVSKKKIKKNIGATIFSFLH